MQRNKMWIRLPKAIREKTVAVLFGLMEKY